MIVIIEILLLVIVALLLIYKWATHTYDFFAVRDIPYEKPYYCFGNFKGLIFRNEAMFHTLRRLHQKFNGHKIYGAFEFRVPLLGLRDPDLIKQVFIKDFDHFVNHRFVVGEDDDPLFGNSLLFMHDEKWKAMRSTLSPAFTGNKMRLMFEFIKECCEESVDYLKNKTKTESNYVDLDMKDFFTRFTNDVIATSAFGLKVNSLKNGENEFYQMGKKITTFTAWTMLKFLMVNNFNFIMRFLRVKIFDPALTNYFKSLVLDTMKYREEHNIIRQDMINMLMEARKTPEKSHDRKWTDDEIAAQCFIFFLAGFDTSSNAMCFAAHELMENPETQEKLLAEVDNVREELNGKPITYEVLQKMKYLDMVFSETLRKWPGTLGVDRVCTKPYTLNLDDRELQINVGDICFANISGLHYDPEYFPDPEKFDPERFNDENKNKINPYTYVPFGIGPRNCIGNRFALMECKIILYYLLSEFKFEACEKTGIPLFFEEIGFQLKPKGGFWLKIKPRN